MTTPPVNAPELVTIDQIPGYKEAVALEQRRRLIAFFDVGFEVHGFTVMPLTRPRLLALELANSPFLNGVKPSPMELEQFLWAMSPQFVAIKKRKAFHRQCVKAFYPSKCWPFLKGAWAMREAKRTQRCSEMIKRIYESLEADFGDAAKASAGDKGKSFYHWSVSLVAPLVRAGFDEAQLDQKPIAQLLQYSRENRENEARMAFFASGQKRFNSPLSNPSDRVVMDFCKQKAGVN